MNFELKIKNMYEVEFDLKSRKLENFDSIRRLTMTIRVQMKFLTYGMLQLGCCVSTCATYWKCYSTIWGQHKAQYVLVDREKNGA
jgi:hypothetical protein